MCVMATRTGAELFVRDAALALQARGHSVTVYAPIWGDMADELRAACVACVSDLQRVAHAPDLIVGNTRDETVACLAHFLGVPAMSICHDRTAPHGQPPLFSRIRQHVAVDDNCAERLSLEHGIARAAIAIVGNGVDLQRFRPRSALPAQPARAAIFSNYATESEETRTIRAACAAAGMALDVIGAGTGQQAKSPERVLGQYDLVFAKARAAMEAMAVGCAVVLYNENMGLGGMVSAAHLQRWHRWNFGRRLLQLPVSLASVGDAIRAYHPQDAALVSAYVREHASLQATVSALEALALQTVSDEAKRTPVPAAQELREFARHVSDTALPHGPSPVAHQLGELAAQLQHLQAQHHQHVQHLEAQLSQLRDQAQLAAAQHAHATQRLNTQLAQVQQHRDALLASASWRITAPLRWLAAQRPTDPPKP